MYLRWEAARSTGQVICPANERVNLTSTWAGLEKQSYTHEVVCLGIEDVLPF